MASPWREGRRVPTTATARRRRRQGQRAPWPRQWSARGGRSSSSKEEGKAGSPGSSTGPPERNLGRAPARGLGPQRWRWALTWSRMALPIPGTPASRSRGALQAASRSPQWRSRAVRRLQPTPGQDRQSCHHRRRVSLQPRHRSWGSPGKASGHWARAAPAPNGTRTRSPKPPRAVHMYSSARVCRWALAQAPPAPSPNRQAIVAAGAGQARPPSGAPPVPRGPQPPADPRH